MKTLEEDMSSMPGVMTTAQIATYLQVNRDTVYDLIYREKLGALKVGRVYRVPKSALMKYIREEMEHE